jgi:adenylate cyclase, class 1
MSESFSLSRMLQLRSLFVSYNIARVREMIRYLPKRKLELFQLIPFWLHVNLPRVPGYVQSQRTPRGIYRFHDSGFYPYAAARYKVHKKGLPPLSPERHVILGLYLMGSCGTLAQTDTSDFDYWIVVEDDAMDAARREAFQEKLKRISAWCRQHYEQEVGLFVLPLSNARRNRFVALDEESAGSSQRTLLKEEFYRTFMMIAGKIPYWSIIPSGLDPGQYDRWVQGAQRAGSFQFIPEEYVDLGGLDTIDRHECLGALLWQTFKACKSPFKSLVKGALIAHYYFFADEKGLLCDHIKSAYADARPGNHLSDPYAAAFQTATDFFRFVDNDEGLQLLRDCIFLRLWESPRGERSDPGEQSPRQRLLAHYLSRWEWEDEKIHRMASFHRWPEGDRLGLEERIFRKLAFLYELIQRAGGASSPKLSMTAEDLTALRNRIAAALKKRQGKLPRCSGHLRSHVHGKSLELCGTPEPGGKACWTVSLKGEKGSDRPVFRGPGLMRMVGWLLANGFYSPSGVPMRCQSAQLSIGPGRIRGLIREVHRFLSPKEASSEGFASPAQWEKVAVLLFPASDPSPGRMLAAEFLAVNSWGEFFFEASALSHLTDDMAICYKLAEFIFRYYVENSGDPPAYQVFQLMDRPDEAFLGRIESALASFLNRTSDARRPREDLPPFQGGEDAPLLDLV